MRERILTYIEKNSRIDLHDLAVVLDAPEADVMNELERMEEENIICGYHTLINWEKAGIEKDYSYDRSTGDAAERNGI